MRDTPDYGDAMSVEVRLRPFEQGEFATATEQEAEYDDFGPKAGLASRRPAGWTPRAPWRSRPTASWWAWSAGSGSGEGTARGAQWRDGGYRDVCTYAVLRADWS